MTISCTISGREAVVEVDATEYHYAHQRCPQCHTARWMRIGASHCGLCHVRPEVRCDRLAEPLTISREELEYQEMDQ